MFVVVQETRGVEASLLVTDDPNDTIKLGDLTDFNVEATFQTLLTVAQQTINLLDDEINFMNVEIGKHIVYVHRVRGEASLVNICKASIPRKHYLPNIEKSVKLLDKVFDLLAYYN